MTKIVGAKLFKSFNRSKITGYDQYDFEKQHSILMATLSSCKEIAPKQKSKPKEDDAILSLLKSKLFWAVIVVVMGGAFSLGHYFGNSKFDNNLINLSDTISVLKTDIRSSKDTLPP